MRFFWRVLAFCCWWRDENEDEYLSLEHVYQLPKGPETDRELQRRLGGCTVERRRKPLLPAGEGLR